MATSLAFGNIIVDEKVIKMLLLVKFYWLSDNHTTMDLKSRMTWGQEGVGLAAADRYLEVGITANGCPRVTANRCLMVGMGIVGVVAVMLLLLLTNGPLPPTDHLPLLIDRLSTKGLSFKSVLNSITKLAQDMMNFFGLCLCLCLWFCLCPSHIAVWLQREMKVVIWSMGCV